MILRRERSAHSVSRLCTFTDIQLNEEMWRALLSRGNSRTVFQTREWLSCWWQTFGRGELILLLVKYGGEPVAVAPLFEDSGLVYLVGSGGSDYLDFVGECDGPVARAIIQAAMDSTPTVEGFVFYHLREDSKTGPSLKEAAESLGMVCTAEPGLPAPFVQMTEPGVISKAIRKKSLVRHTNYLEKNGKLNIEHLLDAESVSSHLDTFFEQHIARWAATPYASLFNDSNQREFYRKLTLALAQAGWLRFTRVKWKGSPVAFHFGFSFGGTFMWYKPSFDVSLAKLSPGEVLLRQLLIRAHEEGSARFDFGLGDEAFKDRFATGKVSVSNWNLYPT